MSKLCTSIILIWDHPFKTNFHNFWSIPPSPRHSSKMTWLFIEYMPILPWDPYSLASANVCNGGPPSQCPKWQNIAKKLRFFSKPNWVARINIWIMPIQNLALLSYFGTSKLPILVPKVGCLRQNFRFDFTVVILLSKFLEKPNKVRA